MCHCACCPDEKTSPRRGFRPLALLFNLVLAWVLLVVGGGTLINTGHPVAIEAGKLIQTVTFVEPTILWAHGKGYEPIAGTLKVLQSGVPVHVEG